MEQGLRRPEWWKGDFDNTGKTQLGWALEAAAAYRAAHPEEFGGVTPSCDTLCDTLSSPQEGVARGQPRAQPRDQQGGETQGRVSLALDHWVYASTRRAVSGVVACVRSHPPADRLSEGGLFGPPPTPGKRPRPRSIRPLHHTKNLKIKPFFKKCWRQQKRPFLSLTTGPRGPTSATCGSTWQARWQAGLCCLA